MITFNNKKNRKIYEQYEPKDYLESWMVKNNDKNLAIDYPTHVSQRGGYYHIDSQNLITLIKEWKKSIESNEEFYMEEYRGSIFRLYLDIDVKLTEKKPFNLIESCWLIELQKFIKEFFKQEANNLCIVTESHGDWADAVSKTSVFKSGFRLYFPFIYLDKKTLTLFIESLGEYMLKTIHSYEYQPKDWKIENIFDKEILANDRARMFGTTKWRRGKILGRIYNLNGVYKDGKLNEKMTNRLKKNLFELLQLTMINLDNFHGEKYEVFEGKLFSNDKLQTIKLYLTHESE